MLRLLIFSAISLSAGFALISGLLSREWGWSEYASDELYVVYYQESQQPIPFYLVNTDGSSEQWRLRSQDGNLRAVDCSPDGRTLAFVTDTDRLSVVTRNGVLYDQTEDQVYSNVSVANNGTVVLFDPPTGNMHIGTKLINLSAPNHLTHTYDIDVSSQGLVLWGEENEVRVFSPDTLEIVMSLPRATQGKWFVTENLFSFYNFATYAYNLLDTSTQIRFQTGDLLGLFSPDATRRAVSLGMGDGVPGINIFIADAFGISYTQLTHSERSNAAICFLTFRPEMLIDAG